ncbi:MAG: hypothetical protein ABSH06_01795 [Thermodesulfobacteriota bacterium]|jgi:hypothetical protein
MKDKDPEFYRAFKEIGIDKVWGPEKVIAITDLSVPTRLLP